MIEFTEPLTVGQLRELLTDVSDDTQVVLATADWYDNVEALAIPDSAGDTFTCVTLFHGGEFDSRQV